MKRYLLPPHGEFYKANLHCHTDFSDGRLTPAQIKEEYKSHGYSIVAYTDHDILISHQDLRDEQFLPLNGFEMEVHQPSPKNSWVHELDCHMCLIALDPDNLIQPCYHRSDYLFANAVRHRDEVRFDESQPDYVREYSHQGISDMMRRGREAGFFVTYNHPTWSREGYENYIGYRGMHAMEIYNHSCAIHGWPEYNARVYEDFLNAGNMIYVIAADDNHNVYSPDSGAWDSRGGFTMIKAEALEYKAVTDALVAGHFYASFGPEIHDLYFEDGNIHITCSPARQIICSVATRRSTNVIAKPGETVTEADFTVQPDDGWVRITVVDEHGCCADTNAWLTDELFG